MQVPEAAWGTLDADGKRRRLLDAAERVFVRAGIDAPVPEIAAEAGTGIGTVYRQFSCREELVAALVLERIAWSEAQVRERDAAAGAAGAALEAVLVRLVERQGYDDVLAEALARTSGREEVALAVASFMDALGALLARARAEGSVRADATLDDVGLLFAATRAA
ncbi:MAG TPA: helix-turn-helix domain-containing protein, partial [Conexibacter sp.]|nr:helix-turn-helix domain-containing protein [Conexibacter sp.]